MSFNSLKLRIKKNEGYSRTPYRDQLGFYTIGYGHLIKNNENFYFKTKYNKSYFDELFNQDFEHALKDYKKNIYKKKHTKKDQDLLIEMTFQLGCEGVLKFKKMLYHINKKEKNMACFEMMKSLWYKQTPKRVENLIINYTR